MGSHMKYAIDSVPSTSMPVKVVEEQMGVAARDQRNRLEATEDELEDVKRNLDSDWRFMGTSGIETAKA